MKRIEALEQLAFDEKGFDGFLVANETNMLYLTSCPGATCMLIPKTGESTIYVYSVNYEQVKAEAKGFKVESMKRGENPMAKVAALAKTLKVKKLALDVASYENYRSLAKELRGKAKLKVQGNLVWELRKVKDENELELMRKAGELTSIGMKVAYEMVKPGLKENEVVAEIEYAMRRKGSGGTSFGTIVASGVQSAFPHGGCEDREIRVGDLVVVDVGATYQHYSSDMTRTLVAGKPSEKQKKFYEIVRLAQEKALQVIQPNATGKEVDLAARKVIEKAGYGEYFVHGLGHGVGLEVHEPPTLNPDSKDKLKVGNVFTVEPGVYFVGFGGFRIEDTVALQKRGAEKLTEGPYTLKAKE